MSFQSIYFHRWIQSIHGDMTNKVISKCSKAVYYDYSGSGRLQNGSNVPYAGYLFGAHNSRLLAYNCAAQLDLNGVEIIQSPAF